MKINDLFKTARAIEWWEYKIPPLLAIAYATISQGDYSLSKAAPWLLFLLVALVWGGAFAHTVNDITDLEEDLTCGKSNRMAAISKKVQWMIPSVCFLGGFSFFICFLWLGDNLSAFIYTLPCISFIFYSVPPIRLKQRGILGVFADAFGAHVFISLLMVSSISFFSNQPIDLTWFSLVGLWSLLFGIRGILWHQYVDLENDLKVYSTTFATKTPWTLVKKLERPILGLELLVFGGMLIKISSPLVAVFLALYLALALFRYKTMGHKPVIILNPKNSALQILMLDFYQVFFPVGLLIHMTVSQEWAWVILFIHLLLFPKKVVNIFNDFSIISKRLLKTSDA